MLKTKINLLPANRWIIISYFYFCGLCKASSKSRIFNLHIQKSKPFELAFSFCSNEFQQFSISALYEPPTM